MNQAVNKLNFFEAIAAPVIYDKDCPYEKMKEYIARAICPNVSSNLYVDNIKEIKTRIFSDFVTYANSVLQQSGEIEKVILQNVDRLFFLYKDRDEALRDLEYNLLYLHQYIHKGLDKPLPPKYSLAELRILRDKAQKITLVERVTGTNYKDVLNYYNAMVDHMVYLCHTLARQRAGRFLSLMIDKISREFDLNSPVAAIYNDDKSFPFTPDIPRYLYHIVPKMAEDMHIRWMEQRLRRGWKYAPVRDDEKKQHPYLVPFKDLPEEIKQKEMDICIENICSIHNCGFRIVEV